jgi:hypothetical protein
MPMTLGDSLRIARAHSLLYRPFSSLPPDKPLTLASYEAGPAQAAYVEPIGIGEALPDMPLFLAPERYVNVPLEATYMAAYSGVPLRWRWVLEG